MRLAVGVMTTWLLLAGSVAIVAGASTADRPPTADCSDAAVGQFWWQWQSWYTEPSELKAQELIALMGANGNHYRSVANRKPAPWPSVAYEAACTQTGQALQSWINAGRPLDQVLRIGYTVNQVWLWLSYACGEW